MFTMSDVDAELENASRKRFETLLFLIRYGKEKSSDGI